MFTILHGEDEFSRAEALRELRGRLAGKDAAMADLNTSFLDGSRLAMGELRHACDAIPFMAKTRVVIVDGLLSRLLPARKGKAAETDVEEEPAWRREFLKQLTAYLPALPETTHLFFVEPETLAPSHPVLKLAQAEEAKRRTGGWRVPAGGGEELPWVQHLRALKDDKLPGWIRQRARDKQGEIDPEAAKLLSALVGAELRMLDQELDKLLIYADGQPVTAADVRALVSYSREHKIFDLVDCVGRRETDHALRLLHWFLEEGEAPLYLLTMLARQIRILIQVSELRQQGRTQADIASRLALHPYAAGKALAQARSFSLDQLEAAHRRVVETDWAIKTGQAGEILALDLLVVALTHA